MTGLTIVTNDVFLVTQINKAYLISTNDVPTSEDVLKVFPNGTDVNLYRELHDYKSDVRWNNLTIHPGDPGYEESTNKLAWNIPRSKPVTVENQANLLWKTLSKEKGKLEWEYIVTNEDKQDYSNGFNVIALYDGYNNLLSYGYLESFLSFSLINSVHVKFTVQNDSDVMGITVKLYYLYQSHSDEAAEIGVESVHTNLANYDIASVPYTEDKLNSYNKNRVTKLISVGTPDYTSAIDNYQVKSNSLFSKLSEYRLLQNYNYYLYPIQYIFNLLTIQYGILYDIDNTEMTVDKLLRYSYFVFDDYYGLELVIITPNYIIVTSTGPDKFIEIFYFKSELYKRSDIEYMKVIHTYYRNVLLQINDKAYKFICPELYDERVINNVTYKVYSTMADLTPNTEVYIPINFEYGNLIARFTNTITGYYFENLYSGTTSIDTAFKDLIDDYYSNNEVNIGITQAESNYNLELALYKQLKDSLVYVLDTGILCKGTKIINGAQINILKYYSYVVQGSSTRYIELKLPVINGAEVTSGYIFASNRTLYYQSKFDPTLSKSYVYKYTLGISTEWELIHTYTSDVTFRAFRGLQLEFTPTYVSAVRYG